MQNAPSILRRRIWCYLFCIPVLVQGSQLNEGAFRVNYVGRYEYPSIEEGWYSKKVTDMYILSSEEYAKLKSLDMGITTIYSDAHTSYGGFPIGYYDDFSTALLNIFKENGKNSQSHYYKFYVKKENESTYRFQKVTHLDLDLNEKSSYSKKPNFNDRYFEISSNLFKQLLID